MEEMHGQGMGQVGRGVPVELPCPSTPPLSNPMCLPIWKLTQSHCSKAPKELNT